MPTKEEKKAANIKLQKKIKHEANLRKIQKAKAAKERVKEEEQQRIEKNRKKKENKKENDKKKLEALQKKKEARKQHNIRTAEQQRLKKEKLEARAAKQPEHLARMTESQEEAIHRHQREVELTFDISSMEDQIREMLSKHGDVELMKKNIKGGLNVRFATREAAESLLRKKKNTTINASLMFPITPVVIKQHCLYYVPKGYVIDQEVLNATAEYFSSISSVQQVKKLRNAVLIVFEDEATRDEMVTQSTKSNWKILDNLIGACQAGLPPAINKKRRKVQHNNQQKKKKKHPNGVHH